MEKFKKKLIICAALLLACIAYQFIFDQFLHVYYARFEPIGTYAHYLLMFVTEPFKYFLIGVIVVLLYQNIFTEAPQLPSKLKPICKIVAVLLVLVYLAVIMLGIFRIPLYKPLSLYYYYLIVYHGIFSLFGALWQLGSE